MKPVYGYILAAALLIPALAACTKQEQPVAKPPETLHDRASAVGKFADQTVGSGMQKGLTNAVDKSDENTKRLKDTAKAAEE
jgi:hypothetical protein